MQYVRTHISKNTFFAAAFLLGTWAILSFSLPKPDAAAMPALVGLPLPEIGTDWGSRINKRLFDFPIFNPAPVPIPVPVRSEVPVQTPIAPSTPVTAAPIIQAPVQTPVAQTPSPTPDPVPPPPPEGTPNPAHFLYTFNKDGILDGSTEMRDSTSPYFWISSGGQLIIEDGVGKTIQGARTNGDFWHDAYAKVNPLDTENGKHPQNTFRLVTKSAWQDVEESATFRITKYNLTNTPNRDGYSGLFLMGRYIDQYNLYYAGIRDDGLGIIKKKINGKYYTLAVEQVYGNKENYRKSAAGFLPANTWIGIKARMTNVGSSVRIELFLDRDNNGNWQKTVTTTDNGIGGPALLKAGHGGIRTDYKDVEFDNFEFQGI